MTGGVVETNELDWRAELPPARAWRRTDSPKDVGRHFEGWQVESSAIECRFCGSYGIHPRPAQAADNDEDEVGAGVEWVGGHALTILATDTQGFTYDAVASIHARFKQQ